MVLHSFTFSARLISLTRAFVRFIGRDYASDLILQYNVCTCTCVRDIVGGKPSGVLLHYWSTLCIIINTEVVSVQNDISLMMYCISIWKKWCTQNETNRGASVFVPQRKSEKIHPV